jgi:Helix-turn-helix of DDE superfamily endonuclease
LRPTGVDDLGPPALRHTFAQLAAGFGVGLATAHRYVTEAVDVLAVLASPASRPWRLPRTRRTGHGHPQVLVPAAEVPPQHHRLTDLVKAVLTLELIAST